MSDHDVGNRGDRRTNKWITGSMEEVRFHIQGILGLGFLCETSLISERGIGQRLGGQVGLKKVTTLHYLQAYTNSNMLIYTIVTIYFS